MEYDKLFFTPQQLSDKELRALSLRIRLQKKLPYMTSLFTGVGVYALDTFYLKRSMSIYRLLAAASVGLVIGTYNA